MTGTEAVMIVYSLWAGLLKILPYENESYVTRFYYCFFRSTKIIFLWPNERVYSKINTINYGFPHSTLFVYYSVQLWYNSWTIPFIHSLVS